MLELTDSEPEVSSMCFGVLCGCHQISHHITSFYVVKISIYAGVIIESIIYPTKCNYPSDASSQQSGQKILISQIILKFWEHAPLFLLFFAGFFSPQTVLLLVLRLKGIWKPGQESESFCSRGAWSHNELQTQYTLYLQLELGALMNHCLWWQKKYFVLVMNTVTVNTVRQSPVGVFLCAPLTYCTILLPSPL